VAVVAVAVAQSLEGLGRGRGVRWLRCRVRLDCKSACVQVIRQRLFIFLFSLFLFFFLTFTSFIIAFFSFSLTCSLYLHHIAIYLTSLLKPEAVQLQVHAVNHRHSQGKQAEPGKLATPRTK